MADPNIVYSGLSRTIRVADQDFRVEIYRLEDEPLWALEVVDKDDTSTVWDEQFKSDREALEEVERAVREEGIRAFMEHANVISLPRK
jgi:hypothetical protein